MEPSKKHVGIENFINSINPSGHKRVESIVEDICAWCGQKVKEFKDELSKEEFAISGLCQDCQDDVFDKFEEKQGGSK